jgi:hypothetical protein
VLISQGPVGVSGSTNVRLKRGGRQEGWHAKLRACIQLFSATSEGWLRISSQIHRKLGTWHRKTAKVMRRLFKASWLK